MANNEGSLDRAVRVLFGLVLLSLVFVGPKTAWGYLGAIPFLTALVGYCPIYGLVGLSTNKEASNHA